MTQRFVYVFLFWAVLSQVTSADDWPQWMGPQRDSVWREDGIVDKIAEQGLKVLWRAPIAGGYAGPAVADGKVYLADYERTAGEAINDPGKRPQLEGNERVHCFDAKTGDKLWTVPYNCPYRISYPAGPRVTPTVENGRVYTLGAEGCLYSLNASDGEIVWSKQLKDVYKTPAPMWGFSAHPLIDGDRLFCVVGGKGSVAVALNKHTGAELWRAISASEPGYCPPTMIHAGGRRQLLIWDADKLNGLDPATGDVFWSVPLKPNYSMSIAAPRLVGDSLFASGVGHVAALIKLDAQRPDAQVIWRAADAKESVYSANSTPFIEDGVIYGADCQQGSLMAVDLKTGKRLWTTFEPTTGDRRAGYGTAFLVKHEDRFFLFSETGDLILAKLDRQGYHELGRFHVLEPTGEAFGRNVVWSHPAFANRCVFAQRQGTGLRFAGEVVIESRLTVNLTAVDPRTSVAVPIGISYSANVDKTREILVKLGKAHPDVQEVASCQVTSLGESSVQLTLRVWCAEPGVSKKTECELYEQAKKRFG